MKFIMKFIWGAMAIIGAFMMFGAVGTSDYYVIELGQSEPAFVWRTAIIGCIMMVPATIYLIKKETDEDHDR